MRECPKILKICQITKLDMGFQKKNISSRSENIDFFESCGFLGQCLLKAIKSKVKKATRNFAIAVSQKKNIRIILYNYNTKLEKMKKN